MNYLLERARSLRKSMTEEERILWYHLRAGRFCDKKFRRQKVIGHYIVDFVCISSRLIIELDGSQHSEQQDYDAERTRYLNSQGFRVIRFWNYQVRRELKAVLDEIYWAL